MLKLLGFPLGHISSQRWMCGPIFCLSTFLCGRQRQFITMSFRKPREMQVWHLLERLPKESWSAGSSSYVTPCCRNTSSNDHGLSSWPELSTVQPQSSRGPLLNPWEQHPSDLEEAMPDGCLSCRLVDWVPAPTLQEGSLSSKRAHKTHTPHLPVW